MISHERKKEKSEIISHVRKESMISYQAKRKEIEKGKMLWKVWPVTVMIPIKNI